MRVILKILRKKMNPLMIRKRMVIRRVRNLKKLDRNLMRIRIRKSIAKTTKERATIKFKIRKR